MVDRILKVNLVVSTVSFIILFLFDYPFELVGAAGLGWATVSSLEAIRRLRKGANR